MYEDWSLDKSVQFLKEQGVAVKDSATLAEVQAQVANYADKAAHVSEQAEKMGDRADGSMVPLELVPVRLTLRLPTTRMWRNWVRNDD